MQSETANFPFGAATWVTGQNIAVTQDILFQPALRVQASHGNSNMHRKFGEIWACRWDLRADRQTYRQRGVQTSWSQYSTHSPGWSNKDVNSSLWTAFLWYKMQSETADVTSDAATW